MENQNTNFKQQKEASSDQSLPISNDNQFNPNLQLQGLNMGLLKVSLILKFGSYAFAGQKVGLSASRTKQLLNGHYLPKTPNKIKEIADGWGYDPVVLALLFDKYRREKNDY